VCPKEIKLEVIARMNRDFIAGSFGARGALREGEEEAAAAPRAGSRR
jgi:hypothetical protein